jgi:hypothetical protein
MKRDRRGGRSVRIALLGLILLAPAALADDRQGRFEILGLGNRSCEEYLIARSHNVYGDADADAAWLSWAHGYLTSFNKWVADTYSIRGGVALAELRAWLVEFCEKHQTTRFQETVDAFAAAHYNNRLVRER